MERSMHLLKHMPHTADVKCHLPKYCLFVRVLFLLYRSYKSAAPPNHLSCFLRKCPPQMIHSLAGAKPTSQHQTALKAKYNTGRQRYIQVTMTRILREGKIQRQHNRKTMLHQRNDLFASRIQAQAQLEVQHSRITQLLGEMVTNERSAAKNLRKNRSPSVAAIHTGHLRMKCM